MTFPYFFFYGFGAILTVGTEESVKNRPEPTGQIPESPEYLSIKVSRNDSHFFEAGRTATKSPPS